MKTRSLAATVGLMFSVSAFAASPYVGQESREIKALSPEEVSALVTGKGMGLAKAAELNGFAGPAHVLELANELHLSSDQRARTAALFSSMSARAATQGRALVEKERELDGLFASRTITAERLARTLREIGALQAEVRRAHLEAHLAQVEILTAEQNSRYRALRGYGSAARPGGHGHKH